MTFWQIWIGASNLHWYAGLQKPTFSPPPWFAASASVLVGASIGGAFFRVLRSPDYLPDRPTAIRLILIGLALEAVWTWMFFAGRHPSVALAVAGALSVVSLSTLRHFAIVDRRAAVLLLPWVGAALFAFLLDLSIATRNG